jgi:hypothetical protein
VMNREKKCVYCGGEMEVAGTYNRGTAGLEDYFQLKPESERDWWYPPPSIEMVRKYKCKQCQFLAEFALTKEDEDYQLFMSKLKE